MERYLDRFYRELARKWKGSLVKVDAVRQKNAKKYMNELAARGKIERISWGWYYIPDSAIKGVFDFLRMDRNFKGLVAQTAASIWNMDFIHRDVYAVAVRNMSFGKALDAFGKKMGWAFRIEVERGERKYQNVRGLNVEKPGESVAECMQKWAFTDAFAVIQMNKRIVPSLRKFYWKRVSGTNVRIGQIISYGYHRDKGVKLPPMLRKEIDESIEKVMELA